MSTWYGVTNLCIVQPLLRRDLGRLIRLPGRTSSPVPSLFLPIVMVENPVTEPLPTEASTEGTPSEPPPSYVKLAMRNMVRKGGKSLFHFGLTVTALLGLLVGLSYLTR